ncbi:hypothetical protein [uncultured Aliiroseovarius sp.]|uniref:hypothetical protein n=1 Tax=uncultured Aliiroseovarius sp. TaxID=1658783 RepID=UPI00263260E4|nr:hypothetical protein [uncultured Aliiroseovarius sp.]
MNEQKFREWLKQQDQPLCVLIAVRIALRVFPIVTNLESDPDLALLAARGILTSGVAAKMPTSEVRDAATAVAHADADAIGTFAYYAFAYAAAAAAADAADAYADVAVAADAAAYAAVAADVDAAAYAAAAYADTVIAFEALFSTPIWHEQKRKPEWLVEALVVHNSFLKSGPEWSFWRDWYQGFLDGKPLDWELQRRVALIPDDDWEKGPEHVAKLIEEIRARFALEKRIEALEAEKLVWEEQARHGVGGNNPPEPLESERIVQEIIWAPIEDLKAETQSESPDKSRIQTAISKLGAALIAVGKWSFGKLDAAADAFVKSLGGGLGGYCVGWITQNSNKIAEVIRAAQAWLSALT